MYLILILTFIYNKDFLLFLILNSTAVFVTTFPNKYHWLKNCRHKSKSFLYTNNQYFFDRSFTKVPPTNVPSHRRQWVQIKWRLKWWSPPNWPQTSMAAQKSRPWTSLFNANSVESVSLIIRLDSSLIIKLVLDLY